MLDTGRAQLRFKVRDPLPPGHVSSGSFVIVRKRLPLSVCILFAACLL